MGLSSIIQLYYKAFLDAGGSPMFWNASTLFLYVALIVLAAFIAKKCEIVKTSSLGERKCRNLLWILGGILVLFLGCRGVEVGRDTMQYRQDFDSMLHNGCLKDSTPEPGYALVLKMLSWVVDSADVEIFLMSLFTVYFMLSSIWRYKKHINILVAVLSYVGIYYFQAFSLLRIYLAASFILWNFRYLQNGDYKKFAVVVLLATMFHYSSMIMLLLILFLMAYKKHPVVTICLAVIATILVIPMTKQFGSYMFLARYASYADNNEASKNIGFMLLFDYLPCFSFVFYILKNKVRGNWSDLLVCFTTLGFILRFLAYYITIVGRLSIHMMPLYLIILPYFVYHIKLEHPKQYHKVLLGMIAYVIVRVHFYFIGYLWLDGIMPYKFIWD